MQLPKYKKYVIGLSSTLLLGVILTNYSFTGLAEGDTQINAYQKEETKSGDVAENASSTSLSNNLLSNGDFSQTSSATGLWTGLQANGWNAWVDSNYKAKSPSRVMKVDDNGSLEISSSEPLRAVVSQDKEIDSSKKYQLRFKIKTTDKTGVARVRIIEGEGDSKNLWYSPSTTGTTDWHQIEKEYLPISSAKKIRVELFYETGTGSVSFDDVELVETGTKDTEKPKDTDKDLENNIQIPLGKKHVLNKTGYTYQVGDSNIATIKGGVLLPQKEGTTTLKVYNDKQELVKEIPLTVSPSTRDNYVQLLEDWNDIIAGNRYFDPSNSYMAKFNQELEDKVKQHLSTISPKENRTYLWKEQSNYEKSANLTATYRKLEDIAKQVTNPKSAYYQDEKAIRTVREALEWLHTNVYNSSKSIVGNWWDYEIGTPRAINNTLSLMQEYFSDDEIKTYTDVIEKFVPDPEHFRKTANPFKALGGNLVDMGRVKVIAGLLRKDKKEIADTTRSIEKVFTLVNQGEGFYPDGSYIDHTNVAYTGAYGNVLIDGLSQLLPIIQKTDSPISKDKLASMYHWIDKSFLPLIVHGELMDMSRGRSISRANSEDHVAAVEVLRGINRIAEMSDDATKSRLKATLKRIVQNDSFYTVYDNLKTYRDISLMNQLLNDTNVQADQPSSYISAFNNMDKLAMYNAEKDFGFALSMHSSRTKNYEDMNNENRKGWYTGDGMFYLYNNDLGHYSNNYWPTVNPYKMPGTTETDAKREDGSGQDVLPSGFVGASKLNEMNATAAMDFTNWNKTLSAHKGWFVLKDKVFFLGSNIKNTSSNAASTTIDQRKVDSSSPYKVYVNGKEESLSNTDKMYQKIKSVFLESSDPKKNVGYFFFKESDISMLKQVQEGAWKNINHSQSDAKVSNEFITISQAHKGNGDGYAYALIPNVDRATFEKMAAALSSSLLENNKSLQAVYDPTQQVWGVVKYDNSDSVISNAFHLTKRGLYTIQKVGDKYNVSYYDPEKGASADKSEVFKEILSPKTDPSDKTDKGDKKKDQLPKTGEKASVAMIIVGIFILIIGSLFGKQKK